MNTILFSFLMSAILTVSLFAQEKGAMPISSPPIVGGEREGKTRAVIVGISDYADDRIPDLKYAHRDAEVFANYLQSPAGGTLSNAQLTLLTNEQATAGKIIAALTWLIAESEADDRAIIYFSGHGDVEQVTKFQRGYLLAYDSPGTTYMAGGSLPVGFLKDVITTLSEAGVQVVMVSDACRSGKLAGSASGGTQATSAAIAQQFSNEIKILSCQPDEFSLEGEQWGNGRGCFSYHLVDALTGMADANADGMVSLLETERYLEEKVPAETAPHNQIPMTIGSKNTALAFVQLEAIANLRKRKKPFTISPIDAKGFEEMVLSKADTSVQQLYAAFTSALERGDLMSPADASANYYYEQLLPKPDIEKLKGLMTRNFAAALQDEAQVVINHLLRTDPIIVDDAFSPVSKYDHLPAYLYRAGGLLGEGHYMYRYIKAREYYFKAKACRKENYPLLTDDSLMNLAMARLDTALMYDEDAAFAWFEKGYLQFFNYSPTSDALVFFQKAHLLSPGWALASYFYGRTFSNAGIRDSAKIYLKEALKLDSFFLPTYTYRDLGWVYSYEKSRDQPTFWFRQYVEKMEEYLAKNRETAPITYYNYLGNSLVALKKYEQAEAVLLKGEALSKGQFPQIYNNLAWVYSIIGDYKKSEKANSKAIELLPLNSYGYRVLGDLKYFFQNKPASEAIPLYRKAIKLGNLGNLYHLGNLYLQIGQLDSAEITAKSYESSFPNSPNSAFLLAKVFLKKNNEEDAKEQFHKMVAMLPNFEKDKENYWIFYYKTIHTIHEEIPDSLHQLIEKWQEETDKNPAFFFEMARAFGVCEDIPTSLHWLDMAFQHGWKPPFVNAHITFRNFDFMEVRKTKQFRKLVKKYFPEEPNL